jgi:hypothetical protein
MQCYKNLVAITQEALDERIKLHETIHSLQKMYLGIPATQCDEVPMTRADQAQGLLGGMDGLWKCPDCNCILGNRSKEELAKSIEEHKKEHCPRLTGQVKDYNELELTDEDQKLLKGMLISI